MGCTVRFADSNPPSILERSREWLGEREFGQAKEADCRNCQVTDAASGHIQRLRQLEYVTLGNTKLTDAGLAQ